MTKQVRIYVSPEFKKILKSQASDKDISLLELTRRISKDENTIDRYFKRIPRSDRFEI